jgi:hypothetical protein
MSQIPKADWRFTFRPKFTVIPIMVENPKKEATPLDLWLSDYYDKIPTTRQTEETLQNLIAFIMLLKKAEHEIKESECESCTSGTCIRPGTGGYGAQPSSPS